MIHRSMRERLLAETTFEGAVGTLLHDVVALHGAEFGDVQLPLGDVLVIVAQIGLSPAFLKTFARVRIEDGSACGRALRNRRTTVIADVERDAEYAPFRAQARAAGYRAVQTTPLFTGDGQLMGMVSTLFANVHEPTPIEMKTLSDYSFSAAEHLRSLLGATTLEAKAEEMSARLVGRLESA